MSPLLIVLIVVAAVVLLALPIYCIVSALGPKQKPVRPWREPMPSRSPSPDPSPIDPEKRAEIMQKAKEGAQFHCSAPLPADWSVPLARLSTLRPSFNGTPLIPLPPWFGPALD